MGQSRHLLPPAAALALFLFTLTALGCGSSGGGSESERSSGARGAGSGAKTSTAPAGASAQSCTGTVRGTGNLRVVGVGCAVGRGLVASWSSKASCASPGGASRTSCTVGDYRCLGATTDRGLAVACSRPSRSISFIARR